MRSFLALLLIVPVAACSVVPPAPPAPPPPVAAPVPAPPPPAPVLGSDWRDWPLTPGDWTYRQDAGGSVASFGTPGAPATLTWRCDAQARQVTLTLLADPAATATVRTTTMVRTLPLQAAATPGQQAVTLAAADPLLDAIGFSRGRFVIERAGQPPLVVPAWAEPQRVTEDCRR